MWWVILLGGCVDGTAPANPGDTTEVAFEVPPGSTFNGLGPQLVEVGLAPSEWQWKWFLRSADASCLKAGRFTLRRDMSMEDVRATLCGPPLADDVEFTIVEGWRIRDIDAALAATGWAEPGAYTAVAGGKTVPAPFDVPTATYEGYLYPDTYRLPAPPRFTVEALVEKQLAAFDERFLATHRDEIAASGRSLSDVVTMASMIEREEPTDAQRPTVAGILWKRIDNGWQLGVDATSRYTLADWNDRAAFLTKLRDPSDPYNSRVHHGLPPTPIGNPGITALQAALRPVESENWYYLHDSQGVLHPARDAAGHEANRARYGVY
jgi:UPF0755 protein